MAAMTMAFRVAEAKETAALAVGDHLRFSFRVGESRSVAEQFEVTGHTAPAVTPPTVNAMPRAARLRAGDAVPAFRLIDQSEQPFTDSTLRDHLTVVTFIFTRCPVPEYCPAMAAKFGTLQRTLQADPTAPAGVRLVSITLDPEFDRPDILAGYGKAVGAQPGFWDFVTGEPKEVALLTKAFSVFTERNGVTLDHTLCTALIGRDGRVLDLWRGNGWKIEEIVAALQAAR